MGRIENFRQYAADCVRQAEGEETAADRNILLNVALAWIRLAHQAKTAGASAAEADEAGPPAAIQADRPGSGAVPAA